MAERRGRASQAEITHALNLLSAPPLRTDDETATHAMTDTVSLARQYRLTIYDAAYLELAIRRNASLATSDSQLAKAARASGVRVFR